MKDFILYLILSSICIAIFMLIYKMLVRGSTSFTFNRIYLIFGLIVSFIIPTVRFSYDVLVSNFDNLANTTQVDTLSSSSNTIFDIWMVLFIIYVLGFLIQLSRNLLSYIFLYKIVKGGKRIVSNEHVIIDNPSIKSPFTILNYIIINQQNLADLDKELILKHEIAHVNQKHWFDLLCSECALVVQWFNPFIWLYVSYLKENHKFLADRTVLNQGISPALYQAVLINQRFEGSVFSFTNSFNSNQVNRLTKK